MSIVQAVLLGIVQGLTEFLPVSSSGHLVLAESVLGVRLPGVVFAVTVHVATLCAVLWVYRRRLTSLAVGVAKRDRESVIYLLLLILASVPAGVLGLLGRSWFERTFGQPLLAASLLLLTGAAVISLKRSGPTARAERPRAPQALGVGLAQAVAILPGVSRSGLTVAAGAWLGVDVVRIAEFSFLLSVPAIGGAALLQLKNLGMAASALGVLPMGAGFVAALVSGVLAIRIFLRMLETRTFYRFGYYCWAVGIAYLVAAAFVPTLRG